MRAGRLQWEGGRLSSGLTHVNTRGTGARPVPAARPLLFLDPRPNSTDAATLTQIRDFKRGRAASWRSGIGQK